MQDIGNTVVKERGTNRQAGSEKAHENDQPQTFQGINLQLYISEASS